MLGVWLAIVMNRNSVGHKDSLMLSLDKLETIVIALGLPQMG